MLDGEGAVREPVWKFGADQGKCRLAPAGLLLARQPPSDACFSPSADKLASKLSDSMMSALDLSGNADDSAGD